ncbi:hypothetical protein [Streptomyces sp. AS58]|uniref:hypothetical protein n=1 Tax=Streptomyces sp. AS58 TaxID=1519489 RepID=UPI0006AFEB1F
MIALTRMTPPDSTGLSHWSTRELAKYLERTENITVSWHYVARAWRGEHLKPHRSGTFKISKDPAFEEKVADVIGLYLAPQGRAMVLSIDEQGAHHDPGGLADRETASQLRESHHAVHPDPVRRRQGLAVT